MSSDVDAERLLATVLFTDIVGSTARAAELGDRTWRELLEKHNESVRRELHRWGGREVNTAGDGFVAIFDGPAPAIRCAWAVRDTLRKLGLEVRSGLHMGEIELMEETVGGIGVHIGSRIGHRAGAGEILVSSTVKDLLQGSGFRFEERGAHELKGVPGAWQLHSVSSLPAGPDAVPRHGWRVRLARNRGPLSLAVLGTGLVALLAVSVLRYNLDWKGAALGFATALAAEGGAAWFLRHSARRTGLLHGLRLAGGTLLLGAVVLGFAARPPDPPRVLVLPFTGRGQNDGGAVLERVEGVAQLLQEQLSSSAFLRPVPTTLTYDVYRNLGLGAEGPGTLDEVKQVYQGSGARYLALVEAVPGSGGDSLSIRLFGSTEGWEPLEVLVAAASEPDRLFESVAQFADRLKRGLPASPIARFEREPELADVLRTSASAYQDYLRGRQLYFFDDLPGARSALEEAVRADSTFALAHAWLARVYDRLFDPRAAAELADARRFSGTISERDRDFIEANELLIGKRSGELAQILPRLVDKHAGDVEMLMQLGEMYRALEDVEPKLLDYADARLELYRRLVEAEPRNPTLHKELGLLRAQMGEWELAHDEFEQVVALNPYSADGYYDLGFLNRIRGRYEAALAYFAKADSLRPGFARNELAFTLQELGRYAEAREQYLREIATPGADIRRVVSAHVWLAGLGMEAGDTASARAEIESAARLAGGGQTGDESLRLNILYQEAELAWRRRDATEVERVLQEMQAIEAGLPQVHFVRARQAFLEGDSSVAWKELDATVRSASPNEKPTYLFELGEARRRAGALRQAEEAYRTLLAENPNFARGHFGLGMTYVATGRDSLAARELRRFLELWSHADSTLAEVRQAREALEGLERRSGT
jgi:class 3 adenylate cyclase/tetratricopeptide (TPR) repeat protein